MECLFQSYVSAKKKIDADGFSGAKCSAKCLGYVGIAFLCFLEGEDPFQATSSNRMKRSLTQPPVFHMEGQMIPIYKPWICGKKTNQNGPFQTTLD